MTCPHHGTAQELDLTDDWVTPDDIALEDQRANDPGYLAAMARYLGPPIKRAMVISAAQEKDFTKLVRLTTTYPEVAPLALRARMVVLAAQRRDFGTVDRLTAKYPELTQLAFDALPRDLEISVASASGKHVSKPGKKKQLFTQSEIERAQRAAPDRAIVIRRSGDLELVPPVAKDDEDSAPPNPWEQEDDAT